MIKVIFIDFYGTIVHEDGDIVKEISNKIYETGNAKSAKEIDIYWWTVFQKLFTSSYGDNFKTQRSLEIESLKRTIKKYNSSLDANLLAERLFKNWREPAIFEDAKEFIAKCNYPLYIVSNIDNEDIYAAIKYHSIITTDVYTSEDARSYKPRKELFQYALNKSGLNADEVIHIGDSISSDIKGASLLGIKSLLINRNGKEVPDGIISITRLTDAYMYI